MTEKPRVRCDSNGTWLADGLSNVVANLGTPRDKASHTTYTPDILDSADLVNAYRTSWLAAAIVDYPAEDATRKWRNWRAEADQITKIEAVEKRLGLKTKVQAALITSRLLGGSAIYINTGSADPRAPLTPGEEVRSLVVLSKDQITPKEIVKDIDSEYFGRSEFYTLFAGATGDSRPIDIHASRFAIFPGAQAPGALYAVQSGSNIWGDSVLQKRMAAVKSADSAVANISSLMYEANVDVMRVQGYAQMLENNQDEIGRASCRERVKSSGVGDRARQREKKQATTMNNPTSK